ncbi:MAG TPA: fatty acid--CoA ligase family protein [Gemmataceae bacterium]|jgi:long-chain acyl-CoA synthetase|nr:fatty acid--CoA ligase family protein [Gemmataceae bacterium]
MSPSWLLDRLRGFRCRPALVWQGRDYSYLELLQAVGQWSEHLAAAGIRAGECVGLRGTYSPAACSLLLALIDNRNIIVPLSGKVDKDVGSLLDVAGVSAVFSFDAQDAWTSKRRQVSQEHALFQDLRDRHAAGLILFTSGSTGVSKAALLDFDRLLQRFTKQGTAYRTLIFMEPDHIGGINTLFHVLCAGGTIIPVSERTPHDVCRTIELHRAQLLPTTPTFLTMLLMSEAYRRFDLSPLELITYGTEPMPASTLQALNKAFPNIRFKQTYGLSEVGILPTASEDSRSLWLKMGGAGCETKVVEGVLWIRAETAMLGYLNAPSPFDVDGWLNTGDVVVTKGDYLRILGRASEAINVGGEKVFPAEVESVLLQVSNVREATVYGRPNPVTGNVVAAAVRLFQPEDPEGLEQRVRQFCKGRLERYKVPVVVELGETEQHNARFKKIRNPPESFAP